VSLNSFTTIRLALTPLSRVRLLYVLCPSGATTTSAPYDRVPSPCRIRSQVFSTSQRLTRLVALRLCFMPLTPMGFRSMASEEPLPKVRYSSRSPFLPCRSTRSNRAQKTPWCSQRIFRAAPEPSQAVASPQRPRDHTSPFALARNSKRPTVARRTARNPERPRRSLNPVVRTKPPTPKLYSPRKPSTSRMTGKPRLL